ncbi:hypothetical protein SAMN05216474_0475 [Lishizhenia tianjinensis]|uniref:Cthe-2314-like HEPN domain-containing protein n=1 Tax=Lishizhenia tianjinensis TaxID=477690 RepID=A0A1I6XWD9_9FLAO|nr:hypothetical protein [Lishizhenia tianjinensis]SFT42231.1 hypothetical protein SAMN05216474_0475 [Lishizhenia tianjinensis]
MPYSILDATNDFTDLSNEIGMFKKKLCEDQDIPYSEEGVKLITPTNDIRFITLDSIQQILLSLSGYIRGFMDLQRRINNTEEFLKVLNLGVTVDQMEKGLVYKFPIESLVTMVHFQIDSYFGEVCSSLNEPKTGFYNRMVKVLEEQSEKEQYQNSLQCLASIRNSFHSRGFHTIHKSNWNNGGEPLLGILDREFEKDGYKIEFKHKEVIRYNWKSMFLLIKESVCILKKVISANEQCV